MRLLCVRNDQITECITTEILPQYPCGVTSAEFVAVVDLSYWGSRVRIRPMKSAAEQVREYFLSQLGTAPRDFTERADQPEFLANHHPGYAKPIDERVIADGKNMLRPTGSTCRAKRHSSVPRLAGRGCGRSRNIIGGSIEESLRHRVSCARSWARDA